MLTTLRRALAVLGASALLFSMAPSAQAADSEKTTADGTNWFWRSQNRTTISEETGEDICPEEAPVCPDPQLGLRSPHSKGALPVQVLNEEEEKVSAVRFDLSFIPPQGATIDSFIFTIVESPDAQDQAQTVNAGGKTILACPIGDNWPPSEDGADEMEVAPKYNCDTSVEGERDAAKGRWTFDITELAGGWGDPLATAEGVMLVGKQKEENWQVVLKGPRRDDPATPEDEQKDNAKNIQAQVEYTPNSEPTTPPPPPPPGDSTYVPPTSPTFPPPADDGSFGFDTTTSPTPPPAEFPTEEPPAEEEAGTETAAPVATGGPETPAYVWALLPLGLVAFSLVRNSFAEPVAIRRPDGVVAMIRRQNAERRGAASPDVEGPFAGVKRFFQKAGRGLKRAATKRSGS